MLKENLEKAAKSKDPAVRAAVAKYLEVLARPLYSFRPRPDRPDDLDEQSAFVRDKVPGLSCVIGGTGSGKSFSASFKVAKFLLYDQPPPRPNCPYWCVSQTREMSSGNGWGKNLSQFVTPDFVHDIAWYNQARGLPKAVILKPHANGNNWVIEFHSYDMDRRALQAFSLGGFWCDELCPYSILMELWGRCRDYDFPASKLYTLTPIVDGSKGYDTAELEEIYKNQTDHPDWKFYRLNSRLNDALAPGFIDRFVANEVEELRETRLTGAFCSLSGAVYKGFNDGHVCEAIKIPDDWYHLRAIDFGWSHETAVLWIARNPSGHYFIYHEYHKQETTLDKHLEAVNGVKWGDDEQYWGETWADSAAAQERAELHKMGLQTRLSKKDVLPGIACVQKLLREGRIHIFSHCKTLIRQMRAYCWSSTSKDKVAKQDDDCVDCLRYGLFNDVRNYITPEPKVPARTRLEDRERKLWGGD